MAFETITTTTETIKQPYPYFYSFIVSGTFLFVALILWAFHNPVQSWWHHLSTDRLANQVVELPQPLVAEQASTPTPGTTPTPTTPAVAVLPSATPYIPSSSITTKATPLPNGKLPKTGPAEDAFAYLLISGVLVGIPVEHIYRKRSLRKALHSLDILAK